MMYMRDNELDVIYTIQDRSDVEQVLQVLNGFGFPLQAVLTSGEHSSHDCTYSFASEYATYEGFVANVYRDFEEETERYKSAATVDWSHTRFVLSHPTDWDVSVFMMKREISHDHPDTAYLRIQKKIPTDEDKALVKEWLAVMSPYLAL